VPTIPALLGVPPAPDRPALLLAAPLAAPVPAVLPGASLPESEHDTSHPPAMNSAPMARAVETFMRAGRKCILTT
jgi:hypothetical protein